MLIVGADNCPCSVGRVTVDPLRPRRHDVASHRQRRQILARASVLRSVEHLAFFHRRHYPPRMAAGVAPRIAHLRHADPARFRLEVREALRSAGGSVPAAAAALGTTPTTLRGWLDADPTVAEGIERKPRGWTKGVRRKKPAETKGGEEKS